MKRVILSIFVAAALWFVMFSPWTAPHVSFWWAMTASALVLTSLALLFGGRPDVQFTAKEVFMGIVIAVMLWCVFWTGDKVSQWMFSFARTQVNLIYNMKEGQSGLWIGLSLLFVIGPAEEIFWRGYVQRTLYGRFGANAAFIATTAVYTLVHLPSLNFMLVMAALLCGAAWGGLFRLFPQHFTAIVVSHALWDAAAFVWFPF